MQSLIKLLKLTESRELTYWRTLVQEAPSFGYPIGLTANNIPERQRRLTSPPVMSVIGISWVRRIITLCRTYLKSPSMRLEKRNVRIVQGLTSRPLTDREAQEDPGSKSNISVLNSSPTENGLPHILQIGRLDLRVYICPLKDLVPGHT